MESDTLRFYDQNAEEFVSGTLVADMSGTRTRFTRLLSEGAYILDFGLQIREGYKGVPGCWVLRRCVLVHRNSQAS